MLEDAQPIQPREENDENNKEDQQEIQPAREEKKYINECTRHAYRKNISHTFKVVKRMQYPIFTEK